MHAYEDRMVVTDFLIFTYDCCVVKHLARYPHGSLSSRLLKNVSVLSELL